MEYVTLNNGIKMPQLGYGVYQTPPEDTKRCVLDAIDVGYRSIDTAQAYHNEEGVGRALADSGLPREEFFLTTKVWITNAGYEKALASIAESMEKLRTDYLDLLLIHQPFGDYYGTYRAMEELYRQGKLRAIGVSNFGPDRFLDLQHFAQVKPAVNQIETHVFQQQKVAKSYLQKYSCQIESWGPFAEGRKDKLRLSSEEAIRGHRKRLAQAEKRLTELDRLFIRIYEDNVDGRITDERFSMMSRTYEDEQTQLKMEIQGLQQEIEVQERQIENLEHFIQRVHKYEDLDELTPYALRELVKAIYIEAPDKSSGKRRQNIRISYDLVGFIPVEELVKEETA